MTAMAKQQEQFTWQDYQAWPDGERWELIDGQAYNMSPAPSTRHQAVSLRLASLLERLLAGKGCRPFIAPTDVRLSETDVVQPDVLVVCDPGKITPSHIEGTPELVAEVLSPATAAKDLREKKALYERAGVGEYLILDPLENYALLFRLGEDGRFGQGSVIAPEEKLQLQTLDGLEIPLWELFDLPAPDSNGAPRPPEARTQGSESF